MAGKGKFKIGAEVGYVDNIGAPLLCGSCVRHVATGVEGVITQYGTIKGKDGAKYKLCDNYWEVTRSAFNPAPEDVFVEPDDSTPETKRADNVVREKTLDDFTPLEIAKNFAKRYKEFGDCDSLNNMEASMIIAANIRKDYLLEEFFKSVKDRCYLPTDLQTTYNKMREMYGNDLIGGVDISSKDADLADELRRRGYEVKAEKIIVVNL